MPIFKKTQSIVQKVDPTTGYNTEFDKPYLLLLVPVENEDDESGEFTAVKGRKTAYEYLRDHCLSGQYKILKSQVMAGGITFGNEVSAYTFLRLCITVYQYGTEDDLDMIHSTIMDDNPSISEEYLDKFYNTEIYSSPK